MSTTSLTHPPVVGSEPRAGAPVRARGSTAAAGLRTVLVCLTMTTGLVDAACYLGMGHVLVANMTGNIVFLGFALGGAKGFSAPSFLAALGSFLLGAAMGGRLAAALEATRRRWLIAASGIQTLLAAAAAVGVAAGGVGPAGPARFVVIALLGAGTGLQNATIRRLAIPDLTTTVLTMTLTGLAADSSLAGGHNPRPLRRLTSVSAMLLGGVGGAALMTGAGFTATLIVLAVAFAVVTAGFAIVKDAP